MPKLKALQLPFVVFITGAVVLVLEVVATRVLSTYFGNTVYSVSSVISVILGALSIGYYAGGRWADRHPQSKGLYLIILYGAVAVTASGLLRQFSLPHLGQSLNFVTGPLIAATLLFFIPALLLGMVSPYAVVLERARGDKMGVGTASGNIFFWSTLGSIAGSLATGFILIPSFGLTAIIAGSAVTLGLLGALGLLLSTPSKRDLKRLVVTLLAVATCGVTTRAASSTILYHHDGVYESIVISQQYFNGHLTRFLHQDLSNAAAKYTDSDEPVYGYMRYEELLPLLVPGARHDLVIGGGAYIVPRSLLQDTPAATVDVTEIEPSLLRLSQQYFGLKPNRRLQNHLVDARNYLAATSTHYDIIFGDAFRSRYSIPTQLTTKEFFALTKSKLTSNGVFMVNVNGTLRSHAPSFTLSEIKTFQQVFPNNYIIALGSPHSTAVQNLMFVGLNNSTPIAWPQLTATTANPFLQAISAHLVKTNNLDLNPQRVFTDDFSPVEYYIAKDFL